MPQSDMRLYQEPELYEAFFNPGLPDLGFYQAWGRACAGPLLELGCGTGRLLWPLRKTGLDVEGLEQSEAMRVACLAQGALQGLSADIHAGDWLALSLPKRYAGIYLPFNGLQHLRSAADEDAFFAGLRASLRPGGAFALDLHVPQPAILARDPQERFGVDEGPVAPNGERVVAEQSAYDAVAQVLTQTWTLARPDGTSRELSLHLRQYFPRELERLLRSQGFEVLEQSGGFEGEALDASSLRQVLRCRAL